jgi:hypothetical protein
MGNGVVHVHEVEPVGLGHLVQRYRQRERVGGVLEEGVLVHLHLVEEDPLPEPRQAEGLVIRHEVDLVAPLRELEPQLGGHGPGASIGRIAGDADLHGRASGVARDAR